MAQVLVVLRVLVGVSDDKPDGTACRLAFKDPAEQFHPISLLTGRSELALSWSSPVELLLDEVQVDVDACRHTVDHTTDSLAMALSKGGQCEEVSERVTHLVGVRG